MVVGMVVVLGTNLMVVAVSSIHLAVRWKPMAELVLAMFACLRESKEKNATTFEPRWRPKARRPVAGGPRSGRSQPLCGSDVLAETSTSLAGKPN